MFDVRFMAMEAIGAGWSQNLATLDWLRDRAANGEDLSIHRAAVGALIHGWSQDLDILTLLRDRAANDTNGDVRQAPPPKDDVLVTIPPERGRMELVLAALQSASPELLRAWSRSTAPQPVPAGHSALTLLDTPIRAAREGSQPSPPSEVISP